MDRASVAPSEADSVGTGISAQNNRKVVLGKGGVAGHLSRPHANSSLGTASALDTNDLGVEFRYVESSPIETPGLHVTREDATSNRAVEIRSVNARTAYRAVFVVKNKAKVAQRVRITQPSTRAFSVSFSTANAIAPGIEAQVEIFFRIPVEAAANVDFFSDFITIKGELGSSILVPLRATIALPVLSFPSMINFGAVVAGAVIDKTFEISNSSSEKGCSIGISIKNSSEPAMPLAVSPSRTLLAPIGNPDKPSSSTIKLSLDTRNCEPGSYRSIIALDGPGVGARIVDVTCEVVLQTVSLHVTGMGDPVKDLVDFGSLFYGQRQTVKAMLVNNGPQPVTYRLMTGSAAVEELPEEERNESVFNNYDGEVATMNSGGEEGGFGFQADSGRASSSSYKQTVTGRSGAQSSSRAEMLEDSDEPSISGTGDKVLDEAFEKDFKVMPQTGELKPFEEIPIFITYTARDRRQVPIFRAQAARMNEETLRSEAGLPPSPPRKVVGQGKYPTASLPKSKALSSKEETEGNNSASSDSSAVDATMRSTRGRSIPGSRKRPSVALKHRSTSPVRRSQPGMTVDQIAETFAQPLHPVEEFRSKLALIVPELKRTTGLTLVGRGVRTAVSVSIAHVDFGQVLVNGRADAEFTIRNETELLPIEWTLAKCSNFYPEPSSGRLQPMGVAKVSVSFIPSSLGPHNEAMPLIVRPGNGIQMVPPSSFTLEENTGEPIQKGAKNAKLVTASQDKTNLLTMPIALTALSVAPGPARVPGQMNTEGGENLNRKPSVGGVGVGLTSQPGVVGLLARGGGVIGGGVSLVLNDEGGGQLPPGVADPSGSVNSTVLTPFDATAGVTGGASVHAASNAIGPNAMPSVFRRSGALAERFKNMPPDLLVAERQMVSQVDREHTVTTAFAATGGVAMINSDTNAVEVPEERDAAFIKRSGPVVRQAPAWLTVATQSGLKFGDVATSKEYTHTVSKLQWLTDHKSEYAAYLAEEISKRRLQRMKAYLMKRGACIPHLTADGVFDPITIGLDDGKLRLKEPILRIPDASKEPLWLLRPKDANGVPLVRASGKAAPMMNFDPLKPITVKFKPTPTTLAEKQDCAVLIPEEELDAIICGPEVLDLGQISVLGVSTRTFSVFNALQKPILVQLQSPPTCEELSQSSPRSQVVPPGKTAGFDIRFCASDETVFRQYVTYIINGKHSLRFMASATAMPIVVTLEKDQVDLKFAPESLDKYVSTSLKMTNTSASVAEFRWIMRDGDAPFEVEPPTGLIEPGATESALVMYRPSYKSLTETMLSLSVRGGLMGSLMPSFIVSGEEIDARVSLSEKNLDFGRLSVGIKAKMEVTLTNVGNSVAVVYIGNAPRHTHIFPSVMRIDPMDSATLTVIVSSKKPTIIDPTQSGLQISVRGGKGAYLPLAAIIIVPDVFIEEPAINFAGVTLGKPARRRMTLVNRSPVNVELILDLRNQPRFSTQAPRKPKEERNASSKKKAGVDDDDVDLESLQRHPAIHDIIEGEDEDEGSNNTNDTKQKRLDNKQFVEEKKGEIDDESSALVAAGEFTDQAGLGEGQGEEEEDDSDLLGVTFPRRYKIKLQPEEELPIDMLFLPKETGIISFNLPIHMPNVGSLQIPGLDVAITGEGLHPRIKVESTLVDFEIQTWRRNPERRLPYHITYKIYNTDTEDVTWYADTSLLPQAESMNKNGNVVLVPIFGIEPSRATIPVGGTCDVEVSFTPAEPISYTADLPIFLEGAGAQENDGDSYLDVVLKGRGVSPSLSFDRREVVLPPVILGAISTATFYIINTGHDHCSLKFRVPSNEITSAVSVPFKITFPEGEVISMAKKKLPVTIELRSDKPMAFTSIIEFLDGEENGSYGIPVSGVTDNCLLTNYEYLDGHRNEVFFEAPPEKSPSLGSSTRDPNDPGPGAPLGKPNAPNAPAFPSSETLKKAAAMVPAPGSLPPSLPTTEMSMDLVFNKASSEDLQTLYDAINDDKLRSSSSINYKGLVAYLNACCLRVPIVSWPEDVVKQHGRQIVDLVEALSGKTIHGRIPIPVAKKGKNVQVSHDSHLPTNQIERVSMLLTQATNLLTFLKLNGAYVHSVRPENLLNKDDFVFARKTQSKGLYGPPFGAPQLALCKAQEKKEYERRLAASHAVLSLHGWSTVTMQAIKVFLLSRVTMRAIVGLGGMYMDAESKKTWDRLNGDLDSVNKRVEEARAAAAGAPGGVQIKERPSVGQQQKDKVAANKSGNGKGAANTVAAENSMILDFHGPKPLGYAEPSLTIPGFSAAIATQAALGSGRFGPVTGATDASGSSSSAPTNRTDGSKNSMPKEEPLNMRAMDAKTLAEETLAKKAINEFLHSDVYSKDSNVFSSHELLLLRWLNYHHDRVNVERKRRLVDFGSDLTDGSVILYVILSHVPELGEAGRILDLFTGHVHTSPETPKQIRENCIAIIEALKSLGLDPPFEPEHLAPDAFASSGDDAGGEYGSTLDAEGDPFGSSQNMIDQQMAALQASLSQSLLDPSIDSTKSSKQQGIASSKAGGKAGQVGSEVAVAAASGANATGKPPKAGEKKKDIGGGAAAMQEKELALQRAAAEAEMLTNKPAQPLFVTLPVPPMPHRYPGTNRVKAGSGHARDMLLWALWLYTHLPSLVPRSTIDFKGALNATLKKSVILTNPTRKTVSYTVSMTGDSSFTTPGSQTIVKLEPRSQLSFNLQCIPRFSIPKHNKLLFAARRDGTVAPSILVFALRSIVTSRPPVFTKTITGPMYKITRTEIEVTNTSSKDGVFDIRLEHVPTTPAEEAAYLQNGVETRLKLNPSFYSIGSDGELPHHLTPGYKPINDQGSSSLSAMNEQELLTYGMTKEEASQIVQEQREKTKMEFALNNIDNQSVSEGGSVHPSTFGGGSGSSGPGSVVSGGADDGGNSSHSGGVGAGGGGGGGSLSVAEMGLAAYRRSIIESSQKGSVGREEPNRLPQPFWCRTRTVSLAAGMSKKLSLHFLPFKPGQHRLIVTLIDKLSEVAEVVYEVIGTATNPAHHSRKIIVRADLAKTVERLLYVPSIFSSKEDAYDATLERLSGDAKHHELALRSSERLGDSKLRVRALQALKKITSGGSAATVSQTAALKSTTATILGTIFDISVDSPFFDVPKRVFVPFPSNPLPGSGASGGKKAKGELDMMSMNSGTVAGGSGLSPGGARSLKDGGGTLGGRSDDHDYNIDLSAKLDVHPIIEVHHGPLVFASTTTLSPAAHGLAPPSVSSIDGKNNKETSDSYIAATTPAAVAEVLLAKDEAARRALSRIPIICRPKGAGVYSTRITLTSDTEIRIYSVEFNVEAIVPAKTITFTSPVGRNLSQSLPVHNSSGKDWNMVCSLTPRKGYSQESIRFSCPKTLFVKAGAKADLKVTFSPDWVGEETATLTLTDTNPAGKPAHKAGEEPPLDTRINFDLRGVTEDPLALETIKLEARVREEIKAVVTVYNGDTSGEKTFLMETDIPFLSGAPTVTVPAAKLKPTKVDSNTTELVGTVPPEIIPGVSRYSLTYRPLQSSMAPIIGQVSFTDQRSNFYQWIAIEASAGLGAGAGAHRTSVSTTVRKAVTVQIFLSNPTDLEVVLEASVSGDGLIGEPFFAIGPGETKAYELLYAPLFPTVAGITEQQAEAYKAENTVGMSSDEISTKFKPLVTPQEGLVVFSAPSIGEVVYVVDLTAYAAVPVSLPVISAPIGLNASLIVELDNPTANEAAVQCIISNSRAFSLDTAKLAAEGSLTENGLISVPPFSSKHVHLSYTPTVLGSVIHHQKGSASGGDVSNTEACIAQFFSQQLGEWTFFARGYGTAPEPAPVHSVFGTIGAPSVSSSITFRNPFSFPITISTDLAVTTEETASVILSREKSGAGHDVTIHVLELLRPGKHFSLHPFGHINIPFSFTPSYIAETTGVLSVHIINAAEDAPDSVRGMTFKFPVSCIGEAPLSKKTIQVKATAREPTALQLQLPLPGWKPSSKSSSASSSSSSSESQQHHHQHHQQQHQLLGGRRRSIFDGREQFSVTLNGVVTDEDVASAKNAGANGAVGGVGPQTSVMSTTSSHGSGSGNHPEKSSLKSKMLKDLQFLLDRSVQILPKKTALLVEGEPMEVDLKVACLKPLIAKAELVVSRKVGGGTWRFPVKISVGEAPPDGEIHVSSPLNQASTVTFNQKNGVPRASNFRAYFTLVSPSEFRVSPSSGVLPSSTAALYAIGTGQEAEANAHAVVPITITFTPREYGHEYIGTLLVESDEMLWKYTVKGTLPRYVPPATAGMKGIDNILDPKAMAALKASRDVAAHRDHLQANIRATSLPTDPNAKQLIPVHGSSTAATVASAAITSGAGSVVLHPVAQQYLRMSQSGGMHSGTPGTAVSAIINGPAKANSFGAAHSSTYLGPAGALLGTQAIQMSPMRNPTKR
jgi:hypothetical protein